MQKNVAGQKIGAQLVSATDGSAFTGSVTVYVTGDAGTQAVGSVGSGACTHEGNGYHTYAPAQAETNYDLIAFTFTGTGAVPVTVQVYTRVDANLTQISGAAVSTSSAQLGVNVVQAAGTAWGSGAITAASIGSNAITSAKIAASAIGSSQLATGAITSAKFAAGAIDAAAIANGAIDAATFAADVDAEILSYLVDDATRIDASALNTLSSHDPGATLGTSTLTQAQVTGGAYALNSASFAFNAALDLTTTQKASVNAEADTALADYDPPTYTELLNMIRLLLRSDSAVATDLASLLTAINADLGSGAGGYVSTTDSQQAIRDRGDSAWITATGFSTHSAADVWAAATRTLTAGTNIQLPSNGLANVTAWTVDITGSLSGSVGSVAGNVGGNVSGSVGSISGITFPTNFGDLAITATTGRVTAGTVSDKTGYSLSSSQTFDLTGSITGNLSGTVGSVTGNVGGNVAGSVGSVTGNVGGNVTGTVGGMTASGWATAFSVNSGTSYASAVAGSVVKEIADNAGGSALTAAAIADAVWDEALSGHTTVGSAGKALSDAGSAGDPWSTSLPGSYGAGTAGYIIGTYLDAAVTSRLAPTTAGRTLDVTAGGCAGVDWANVEAPTTAVGLTGTTIATSQVVASVTGAVGSVTGSIGSLATQAKADVNAEVDTALADYDAPTKAEMDTAFTEIKGATWSSVTDTLEAIRDRGDSAWITATGFSTLDAAGVRTAVGLGAANLDTQLNTIYTVVGNNQTHLTDIKGGTFSGSTDSLEAIRNRGDAAWVTATGFSTLDAAGVRTAVGLATANLDTQLGTIDTNVDSILTDTGTTIPAQISALSIPTAVAIRQEIDSNSTQLAAILTDTGTTIPAQISALSIPTATQNADALLGRNVSNVESSAPEHSLATVVLAVLESSISGTTWTIKRTDGSTTHATKTVTTDANADPVTGVS